MGGVALGRGGDGHPLALAFLVVTGSGEGASGFEGLADLVKEGGSFSYAVLLAAAFGSLLAAILTGVSARRPALPPSLALLAFILPMLAALLGVVTGMRAVADAVAHVAPADKAIILMGATAELVALLVQALAFTMAGTSLVALASLIALVGPGRGPRAVTALAAGALGACLGAMTMQDVAIRSGFRAFANIAPFDRASVLAALIAQWQQLNRVTNALFLGSLAIAVVGGVVLAMNRQRAAGVGVAATLLVAAVGFRGFNALAERQLVPVAQLPAPTLLPLEGVEPQSFRLVELDGDTVKAIDSTFLSRALSGERGELVGVELTPALKSATLLRVLQTAHVAKVNVELIGAGPKPDFSAPPLFSTAVAAASQTELAVPVRVLFPGEECVGCGPGVAQLTSTGVEVGGQAWAMEEQKLTGTLADLTGVELGWSDELPSFVRAASIIVSHGKIPVIRVPVPDPMPSTDSMDLRGGE